MRPGTYRSAGGGPRAGFRRRGTRRLSAALLAGLLLPGLVPGYGFADEPVPTPLPSPGPVAPGESADSPTPLFTATVARLTARQRRSMVPVVWRPGCPVPLRQLRLVRMIHWEFGGGIAVGRLVVHRRAVDATVTVMSELFDLGFPIRRMRPIRRYGGSDFRSIEADNTSAFNCRRVTGGTGWSKHALGTAIDINPLENPYVHRGRTVHSASVDYLQRTPVRPGMLVAGSPEVAVIEAAGWQWGGRWRAPRDYQHIWFPARPLRAGSTGDARRRSGT